MNNIKFKAYIKNLNAIYDVWTMVFLEEWIRVFVKWLWQDIDKTNFLIDWVDNVLMQFTWLYDKNNEPIFEGDILIQYKKYWVYKKKYIINSICDRIWWWAFKIIWNIYLNPELLWNH